MSCVKRGVTSPPNTRKSTRPAKVFGRRKNTIRAAKAAGERRGNTRSGPQRKKRTFRALWIRASTPR